MASSLPEPPPNVPRIVDVKNPGTGHLSVMVRMPTNLASKYPDKPWGTSIADIGLSKKDSDQYEGYTLVDVEGMKGVSDLLWIFEKLDGPAWTTKSKGRDSLVPAKYRRLVTTIETRQDVVPEAEPSDIAGNLVKSIVEQQPDTGKAVKVDTEEVVGVNELPLKGERFAPDGTVLAVSESLEKEATASADKGANIATSEVDPTGDGKAVKQTQTAKRRTTEGGLEEGWPTKQKKSIGVPDLTPAKYKGQTVAKITTTQIELDAADVNNIPAPKFPEPRGNIASVTHEKVNDWRYQEETVEEIITENTNPLVGEEYGDIVTASVTEQLVTDGTPEAAADTGLNVLSSQVDPIGNGKSVKRTKRVKGGWPDPVEQEKSRDVPDLIPAKFRKSVTRSKSTKKLPDMPSEITLEAGETSKAFKRETPDRVEQTTVTEVIDPNPLPLVGQVVTPEGQIATVTESLVSESATVTSSATTLDASVTPLGDGNAVKRVVTVDTVFAQTRRSAESGNLIPAKFKPNVPTISESNVSAGLINEVVTLGGNEISRQEDQIDTNKKRVSTTSFAVPNDFPVLTGETRTEYGIASTEETLVATNRAVAEEGFGILDSASVPLGNGYSVQSKTVIGEFPVLYGTEILAPWNIPVFTTKEIVPAGQLGGVEDDMLIEVKPWDKWHSIQITSRFDISGMPEERFIKDIRYQFPDVLQKVSLTRAYAHAGTYWSYNIGIVPDIKGGPSGTFDGYVLRTFSIGEPDDNEMVWSASPKSDTVLYSFIIWGAKYRDTKGTLSIPSTLHSAITVDVTRMFSFGQGSVIFGSTNSSRTEATDREDIPKSGESVLVDRNSERVRANVWVLEKTYLIMP